MSFEIEAILRRLKPEKRRQQLRRRADKDLPFLNDAPDLGESYLLDTNVYINAGKGRLPAGAQRLLAGALLYHSPVSMAELAHTLGALDPADARSRQPNRFLREVLAHIRSDRILPAESRTWVSAAVLAGILTRTQKFVAPERRKLLNDALLLFTARAHGVTLLSANLADFDLMTQILPDTKVLFYHSA